MAKVYGGRWEITSSLDEGGQAHTFLVRDKSNGTDGWVLKRLKNTKRLGRFVDEVTALQKIGSARIPKIEDFQIGIDESYLVYRYLGSTLSDVVQRQNPTFDEAYDWCRDVAEGLFDAHRAGVVHRDVKPDNILVDDQSPHRRAYVIDFGICQIDEEGAFRTTVDEAFGSREFAAPEMDRGSPHAVSEKSDVYSLGKVLYFALSGGKFISREAIDERTWLDLPSPRGVERGHVRRLITRMVAASPDDRLSSAEALREIERAGTLMRSGVSAVGSRDQLCPACRVGSLERRKDEGNLGFREIGNPSRDVRLLWCNYCGFLRRHFIDGTQSQRDGLWEI